jgi:hypothetical protein
MVLGESRAKAVGRMRAGEMTVGGARRGGERYRAGIVRAAAANPGAPHSSVVCHQHFSSRRFLLLILWSSKIESSGALVDTAVDVKRGMYSRLKNEGR